MGNKANYIAWFEPVFNKSIPTLLTVISGKTLTRLPIWLIILGHHWYRQWLAAWLIPSHYLSQWWLIVNWTLRKKLHFHFKQDIKLFIQQNAFENVICKMSAILGGFYISTVPLYSVFILYSHANWQQVLSWGYACWNQKDSLGQVQQECVCVWWEGGGGGGVLFQKHVWTLQSLSF